MLRGPQRLNTGLRSVLVRVSFVHGKTGKDKLPRECVAISPGQVLAATRGLSQQALKLISSLCASTRDACDVCCRGAFWNDASRAPFAAPALDGTWRKRRRVQQHGVPPTLQCLEQSCSQR